MAAKSVFLHHGGAFSQACARETRGNERNTCCQEYRLLLAQSLPEELREPLGLKNFYSY